MTRLTVLGSGVVIAGYGLFLLLGQGWTNLIAAGVWLAGGVLLHDAVLAPVVLALVWLGARVLPVWARVPAAWVLLVLGSVTLLAVPVLGRLGARPDNPTLLDRDYTVGWIVLAALTIATAGWVGWARRSQAAALGAPGSQGPATNEGDTPTAVL